MTAPNTAVLARNASIWIEGELQYRERTGKKHKVALSTDELRVILAALSSSSSPADTGPIAAGGGKPNRDAEIEALRAAADKAREVLRSIIQDRKAGVHYAAAAYACHMINAALAEPRAGGPTTRTTGDGVRDAD